MTYLKKWRGSHSHRFFVDGNSGDMVCLCGIVKGQGEKRAKYHNVASEYNGVTYHSALEARYAAELDWLVKGKQIKGWDRQVKLELHVNGMRVTNYWIDFVVRHNDGSREFVEVKGYETPEWTLKWRILEATFEDFREHPDDRLTVVKQSSWGRKPVEKLLARGPRKRDKIKAIKK